MTRAQVVILDQSIRYLRIRWQEEVAAIEAAYPNASDAEREQNKQKMQERAEYINKLEKHVVKGECFGFSVCHGAMALLGKQDWWEDALLRIYKWDGSIKKLDEEIILKNAKQPTTLRKLFELAFGYIVHSQSFSHDGIREFFPGEVEITQLNALSPDIAIPSLAHLQILKDDGTVMTVQKNETVAGHFSKEQMRLLLDAETFTNNLCLVHGPNHTIRVSYLGNDKWQIYDPSAFKEARHPGALHFTGTKDEIIDMVFAAHRGSQDLAIEVAAMNKDNKINLSAYLDFMLEDPAALLTKDSLYLMALKTPETLQDIFELAAKPEYRAKLLPHIIKLIDESKYLNGQNILHVIASHADAISPSLFALMDNTAEGKSLRSVIAKKLLETETEFHQTPLFELASFSPAGFMALVNAAASDAHNDELIHAFSQVLYMKVKDTNALMLDCLVSSPPAYCALLELAAKPHAQPLRIALVKVLSEKMDNDVLRITNNIFHAPAMLPYLMIFMNKVPDAKSLRPLFSDKNPDAARLCLAVSKALPARYDDNHNVLHMIAKHQPELIKGIFRFILSDHEKPNTFGYLVTALAADSEGVTGWHMITDKLPQAEQKELADLLASRLEFLKTPELIMFAQELNRALTDQQARFRGLCSMSHNLFQSHHYGKSEIWRTLLGKTKEILQQRNESDKTPGLQEVMNIKLG